MPNLILRRRLSHLLVCLLVLTPLLSAALPAPARAQSSVEVKYLARGTRYETAMYIIRGPRPGPVFMITGGVHGSEAAGWMAARRFVDREIQAGTFIVIPEANKPGVEEQKRIPSGGYDLNRAFPTAPNTEPTKLLAREIWNVFKTYRVEWYVDLHEALDFYKNPGAGSVGQTLIHYPRPEATRMGNLAVRELNQGITKSLHQFTLLRYPVQGSIARAAGQYLGIKSFIFETSRKLTLSTRVAYQTQLVEIFLRELGMAGSGGSLPPAPPGDDPPPGDDDDDPGADPPSGLEPGLNLVTLLPDTPDAATLYIWESGVEGPAVLVVGGLRGDEPGGVTAAGLVRELTVGRGRLLVLPEANARAIAAGTRAAPGESDLNRAFPRSAGTQPSGALAAAIWQALAAYRVDHLVSFVEGADYYLAQTGEYGQTIIHYPADGVQALAEGMAADVNLAVQRNLATFSVLRNPVPGSLARAAGEVLGVKAFLVELSAREPLADRAEQGARIADSLLVRLGMKEPAFEPPSSPDPGPGVTRQVLLAGTPYRTTLSIHDSGQPGPVVLVVGGLRGDEPATTLAAAQAQAFRVDRGRLLVLAEANRLALELGQRTAPGGDDLNRQFPRQTGEQPADPLAAAIWQAVREHGVQYVLTLTEDPDYRLAGTGYFGHTLIHAGPAAAAELAEGVAADLNRVNLAELARFSTLRNPAPGSLARAAGDVLGAQAILLDLCSREPLETRVELGLRAADALLARLGMRQRSFPVPSWETRVLLTGTPHATPLHVFNAAAPGPTVLVVGGLRGDEPGGVEAARAVAGFEPAAGRLLVLPEANRAALAAGTRTAPGATDLNRAFPQAKGETPADPVARAIWALLREQPVDYLVSFVEGADYYLARTGEFGQTIIHYPVGNAAVLAEAMAEAANRAIWRALPRFTVLRNPVRGSLARAAGEILGIPAFLVELSRKETLSSRAEQGGRAVDGLLTTLGMGPPVFPEPPPPQLPPGATLEWLAPGTKDATPLYRLSSGQPGPVLLVVGGLRGDESWSPAALRSLLATGRRPARGTLLLLPEANRLAVELGARTAPGEDDLNRAFPQTSDGTPGGPLAVAIWDALRRHGVTHLITFVEGADYYRARTGEYGQTIIYYPGTGTQEMAQAMVRDLSAKASTQQAEWTALRNPVRGSLARAAGELLGVHAFLVEVSAREPAIERVNWALRAVDSLMARNGMN